MVETADVIAVGAGVQEWITPGQRPIIDQAGPYCCAGADRCTHD